MAGIEGLTSVMVLLIILLLLEVTEVKVGSGLQCFTDLLQTPTGLENQNLASQD